MFSAAVCPPGFQYLSTAGSCYQVLFLSLSWYNASNICKQVNNNSYLAVITSSIEQNAIESFLKAELSSKSFWIQTNLYFNYFVGLHSAIHLIVLQKATLIPKTELSSTLSHVEYCTSFKQIALYCFKQLYQAFSVTGPKSWNFHHKVLGIMSVL